jgi:hypothetical protein
MEDNIKPSILLSGFVSSFKENDEIIYLITYHSNGKSVSKARDTFDSMSMIKAIQLNTNISYNSIINYIYEHIIHSNRLESMEQLEELKNNYKVLIVALFSDESQLQFCNLEGVKRINIANYYGKCYYTHNNPDGSVEYLSVDDYENIILDEKN